MVEKSDDSTDYLECGLEKPCSSPSPTGSGSWKGPRWEPVLRSYPEL